MEKAELIGLIQQSTKGDSEAFSKLYEVYYDRVYFLCAKILQNKEEASDIVQETFLAAFQSMATLENALAFEGWLKTIAANKCKNYLKKNKPILFSQDEGLDGMELIIEDVQADNAAEIVDNAAVRQIINDIIDALPDEQRIAVMLYYFDEKSIAEIAAYMECSEGTVKSRLNYARKRIREQVEAIEKRDNIQLHSAGLFPLLGAMLAKEVPHIAARPIWGSAATSAAANMASVVANAATNPHTTKTTASTLSSFFKRTFRTTVSKIIAGTVAGAILIGGGVMIASNSGDNTPANNNQGSSSKYSVSDDQLVRDIQAIPQVSTGLISDESGYQYSSFTIYDRRTDKADKVDVVYCDVITKSELYEATLKCLLSYRYYDSTGWALEEKSVDRTLSITKPIAPPPDLMKKYFTDGIRFTEFDLKGDFYYWSFHPDNLLITNQELDADSQTAITYYNYVTGTGIMPCQLRSTFSSEQGWLKPSIADDFVRSDFEPNWQGLIGTFEIFQPTGGFSIYKPEAYFTITNIDENSGTIRGSIEGTEGNQNAYPTMSIYAGIMKEEKSFVIPLNESAGDLVINLRIDGTYDLYRVYGGRMSKSSSCIQKKSNEVITTTPVVSNAAVNLPGKWRVDKIEGNDSMFVVNETITLSGNNRNGEIDCVHFEGGDGEPYTIALGYIYDSTAEISFLIGPHMAEDSFYEYNLIVVDEKNVILEYFYTSSKVYLKKLS